MSSESLFALLPWWLRRRRDGDLRERRGRLLEWSDGRWYDVDWPPAAGAAVFHPLGTARFVTPEEPPS